MGIKVQKSALPTLFNFARVRAAHQPHVKSFVNKCLKLTDETVNCILFYLMFIRYDCLGMLWEGSSI